MVGSIQFQRVERVGIVGFNAYACYNTFGLPRKETLRNVFQENKLEHSATVEKIATVQEESEYLEAFYQIDSIKALIIIKKIEG